MRERVFQLPEEVRLRAQSQGEAGADWISGLARNVAQLEKAWNIRTGEVRSGGSESLILEARCADDTPAILKLRMPGAEEMTSEADVLQIASGRGYARLLAHDEALDAMLVERLGESLSAQQLPESRQFEIICTTLQKAWIPLEAAGGLTTAIEKVHWLVDFITTTWRELNEPCDRATIDQALAFAEEREDAFDPEQCVLVHGDAHSENTLLEPNQPPGDDPSCRFIDPDGLFAEPACDLASIMRDWNDELLAGDALRLGRARCDFLAEQTGVDERAIWQWGFIERVSTGLVMLQIGMRVPGLETLVIADRWSRGGSP